MKRLRKHVLCALTRWYRGLRLARLYTSVDPAPPASSLLRDKASKSSESDAAVPDLRKTLLDPSLPLFQRYRAMFALRNIGSAAAVDALADGFADESDLFKSV
jgi:deoxyhypusine monooxygenase